jgi:putative membrane protein
MRAHLIGTAIALTGLLAGCVQPYPGPYNRPYGSAPYGPGPYGSAYPGSGPPGYPDYGPPPYPDQGNAGPYQGQSNPPPYAPNYGPPPAPNYQPYPNYGPPPAPGQANAPPSSLGTTPNYAGNPPPYAAPAAAPLRAPAYAMDSGSADRYEIEAATIARNRAQNPAVRNFAEMMITGHTGTTQDLMSAVAMAAMPAPPPPRPTPRQQAMLDQLQRAPANAFDGLYMGQQVTAHQEALAMHRAYADRGDRPALRDFAARTWPKVQMHLDMAQNIRGQQRL